MNGPEFVSEEVPFVQVGNRRVITARQYEEDDSIRDFVDRFRHCFEWDDFKMVFYFIEPEMENEQTTQERK